MVRVTTRAVETIPSITSRFAGALALIAALGIPALGQNTATWVDGDGFWSNANNWSCVINNQAQPCVPDATTDAIVANGSAVTVDTSAATDSLVIGSGSNINVGSGFSLSTTSLSVGVSGSGSLVITGGGQASSINNAFIAGSSGSPGSITVTGSGSRLSFTGQYAGVYVGEYGQGILTVNNGAVVETSYVSLGAFASGASGEATVSGAGSELNDSLGLDVGESGSGSFTIESGGVVNGTFTSVGMFSGSTGSMTVTGTGSEWNVAQSAAAVGSVTLGYDNGATGTLTIDGGGAVNTQGSMLVGWNGSGTLTITGGTLSTPTDASGGGPSEIGGNGGSQGTVQIAAGGSWNDAGSLLVGNGGTATLIIQGGGLMNDAAAQVAVLSGSVGTVTVTGSGSQWNTQAGQLEIGVAGSGTLTIENGAVLSSATDSTAGGPSGVIGNQAGSHGTVLMIGGTWNDAGSLVVDNEGSGLLTIEGGSVVNDTSGNVAAAAGSTGIVRVVGAGSQWNSTATLFIGVSGSGDVVVQGGAVISAQTITIGTQGTVDANGGTLQGTVINHGVLDPLGAITIKGGYTQGVDGTLILDVAGTGAGDFGQLDVSGNATFGGTIDFNFIDGFAPSKGDSFDFINVGGSADFSGATIDIGGLLPGFDYADSFQNGQFILTALNDGVASSPTPEPSAILLFATALLGLAAYCRLKRRGQLALR